MSIDRERKINIEKLTSSQADELSVQLGEKIKEINDKAVGDVNRLLNIYGMEAKMQIVVRKIEKLTEPAEKPKKPRKSKKKDANL